MNRRGRGSDRSSPTYSPLASASFSASASSSAAPPGAARRAALRARRAGPTIAAATPRASHRAGTAPSGGGHSVAKDGRSEASCSSLRARREVLRPPSSPCYFLSFFDFSVTVVRGALFAYRPNPRLTKRPVRAERLCDTPARSVTQTPSENVFTSFARGSPFERPMTFRLTLRPDPVQRPPRQVLRERARTRRASRPPCPRSPRAGRPS